MKPMLSGTCVTTTVKGRTSWWVSLSESVQVKV
jgi:hypothetical protein